MLNKSEVGYCELKHLGIIHENNQSTKNMLSDMYFLDSGAERAQKMWKSQNDTHKSRKKL